MNPNPATTQTAASTSASHSKSKSIFRALPIEDQQKIIDLCNHHTYDEALVILARPRPEGLQLHTSHSALCRFFTSWNDDARKTKILDQSAASLQYCRQASHGSFRAGILALLESRIFAALREGVPVADLKAEFAALKETHKLFLAEERWRRESSAKASQEWKDHQAATAEPSYDFVPLDPTGEPVAAPPFTPEEAAEIGRLDPAYDPVAALPKVDEILATRGPAAARQRALAAGCSVENVRASCVGHREYLAARGQTALQAAAEIRLTQIQRATAAARDAAIQVLPPVDLSTSLHLKTPVNPHHPPKSTSINSPANPPPDLTTVQREPVAPPASSGGVPPPVQTDALSFVRDPSSLVS